MRAVRAFAVGLVAAALGACSAKGASERVWVYDMPSSINFTSPEGQRNVAAKLAKWKLGVRLALGFGNNSFTETIVGGPTPGTASGSYRGGNGSVQLVTGPGTNGPLPVGETDLKVLDTNHYSQMIAGTQIVLVPEGFVAPTAEAPPPSGAAMSTAAMTTDAMSTDAMSTDATPTDKPK